MRLQVFSDLHGEGFSNDFEKVIPAIDKNALIIAAGDITKHHLVDEFRRYLMSKGTHRWILIDGNHEYYGSKATNIFPLVMDHKFNGIRILSCTLYSKVIKHKAKIVDNIADFRKIEGYTIEKHNKLFEDSLLNITRKLNDAKEKEDKVIVVTHFMPSLKSIHPMFAGSKLNEYFGTNLEDLIYEFQPLLWIHGHTHSSFDYHIGDTRILCNPCGYNMGEENPKFNPKLIVEV